MLGKIKDVDLQAWFPAKLHRSVHPRVKTMYNAKSVVLRGFRMTSP
jgi:hypothetical protein